MLGALFDRATDVEYQDGVIVQSVSVPAAGPMPGDRLVRVGQREIHSEEDWFIARSETPPWEPVDIEVLREGEFLTISIGPREVNAGPQS